ncbi:hypothetical protein [Kangiella profundi]|uniref:hypothetical protein n=1 Tax=Kangiella profundi TaxID=1561924 RepID=UPI0012FEEF67|nr:hypothetical protein [Kangiella profundi]GGF04016.1 hypothetical protein GCM10011356_17150 [Kangiella profundi]
MNSLKQITIDTVRILTFRRPSASISTEWHGYLLFGLVFTWIAGIGRYWDSPRAELWQYLGLGSVGYVFILALTIWLLLIPLKPVRWSYKNVLIFITLTSPPAILYAIPVERFMSLEAAQSTNAWFLAIVATWRVALLVWFLKSLARLSVMRIVVGTLLPLTLIVVVLSILNLEHVVFNIMAGIKPEERSPNDMAYFVVLGMAYFSMMAAPFLLVIYAWLAYDSRKKS